MKLFIFVSVVMVFLYTSGFAISLWKEKNKMGALAVFTLACTALVLPYFTYFQT